MTEERRLLAARRPLEDIISDCSAMRRDRTLSVSNEEDSRHECKCGGAGNCPDCPDRKR